MVYNLPKFHRVIPSLYSFLCDSNQTNIVWYSTYLHENSSRALSPKMFTFLGKQQKKYFFSGPATKRALTFFVVEKKNLPKIVATKLEGGGLKP